MTTRTRGVDLGAYTEAHPDVVLVGYVSDTQVFWYDKSRGGFHAAGSAGAQYFYIGSEHVSSWEEGADRVEEITGRRPSRRGQQAPPVEPSLEVLRAAADAVDPFATEDVPATTRRKRDPRVTRYVIKRAGGVSEFSGEAFPWGLKCHHVDAIGQDGPDTRFNVIALTPNEHARADADPEFNALVRERLEEVEPRD